MYYTVAACDTSYPELQGVWNYLTASALLINVRGQYNGCKMNPLQSSRDVYWTIRKMTELTILAVVSIFVYRHTDIEEEKERREGERLHRSRTVQYI